MSFVELAGLEGKYEILAKLREGGMGAVYQVRHLLLEEIRVVKVIRPHLEADEGLRQRFLREARSAVRLRHPNVAQIYDFTVEDDGTSVMVMEFIDGRDLAELLRLRGQLSIDLILEVGVQCLKALSYLHRNEFVHRDISPDNIMLTQDVEGQPLVKLIDLGIAKPLHGSLNLTGTGLFLGKIRYASPEQFGGRGGKAGLDARSDLYSLGVALYELATGAHPIAGQTSEALVAGHLFHPPRSFAETDPGRAVPEELRQVILRALAKSPDDRFADATAFCDALAGIKETWTEPDLEATMLERTLIAPRAEDPTLIAERDSADPEQRLADLHERVEELLREGRLEDAESAVAADAAKDLDDTLLRTLRHRLQALRAGVDRDLAEARRQRQEGNGAAARVALERVRAVDPGNPEAAALEAQLEAAEERRRRQAEEERAHIRDLVDAGDLPAARRALAAATATHGAELFAQVERRIAEAESARQGHEQAVAELGRRLETLLAEGRAATAEAAVERLRAQHGSHLELEAMAQRVAERRADARARLGAAAAQVDAGDLDAAAQQVEEVLAIDRELPEALRLASRIELDRQRRRMGRAEALSRIEAELRAGDLAEAGRQLDEAVAQHGAGALAALSARLGAALEEQSNRRRSFEQVVARLDTLLGAGDLEAADRALREAREAHGATPEIEAVRARLAAERERRREEAERAQELSRKERRAQVGELLRQARERADHEDFAAAEQALTQAQELDPANPAINALVEQVASSRARQEMFPEDRPPATTEEPATTRRWAPAALALLVLALAGTGGYLWLRRGADPRSGPTQDAAPPAAPSGDVLRQGLAGVDLGRFRALVIGNNVYRAGLPQLHSAVSDARALAAALKERFGFEVELLTDATRDQTLTALEKIGAAAGPGDNLLLFYAGHGFVDPVNGRGYWQPVDGEPASTANWISSLEISDLLTDTAARRVLVIADSCFSGALLEEDVRTAGAATPETVRQRAQRRSRMAITSGALQPVLDVGSSGHSVFSGALLEVLRADDLLDARGLFARVDELVQPAAARFGGEQTPRLGALETDGEGDFFLVPGGAL